MSANNQRPKWLVAYDFSPCAESALELALNELQALGGGEARLVHVYELPGVPATVDWGFTEAFNTSRVEFERKLAEETEAMLNKLAKAMNDKYSNVDVTTAVRQGSPAEQVLEAADDFGADRIVVGTHGRKGLSHFVMGSVASRIARLAKAPVLVVKAEQ